MKFKKKIGMLVLAGVLICQGGIVARAAADYSDKPFAFCCQQANVDTGKYPKGVKGYIYCYPETGQIRMNVTVKNYTNGTTGNTKTLNTGTRYALSNNVPVGNKVYLRISRIFQDNTINKGVWSPDCAGSYEVK